MDGMGYGMEWDCTPLGLTFRVKEMHKKGEFVWSCIVTDLGRLSNYW